MPIDLLIQNYNTTAALCQHLQAARKEPLSPLACLLVWLYVSAYRKYFLHLFHFVLVWNAVLPGLKEGDGIFYCVNICTCVKFSQKWQNVIVWWHHVHHTTIVYIHFAGICWLLTGNSLTQWRRVSLPIHLNAKDNMSCRWNISACQPLILGSRRVVSGFKRLK